MHQWTDEFTIICRCEEVTRGEIETAIDQGARTPDDVKRMTRCGMGPCQSKTCRLAVMSILAARTGQPIARIAPPKARFPLHPVHLDTLAGMPNRQKAQVIDILLHAIENREKLGEKTDDTV